MSAPTTRFPTDLVHLLGPGETHVIRIPPRYSGGTYERYVDSPKQRRRLYPLLRKRHGEGVQVANVELEDDGHAAVTLWMPEHSEAAPPLVGPQRVQCGPNVRVGETAAEQDARKVGRTVMWWEENTPVTDASGIQAFRNFVVRAKLAPFDRWLRDRLAAFLKCRPDEVQCYTRWGVDENDESLGVIEYVRITEAPLVTDPKKRRETFDGVVNQVLPVAPNASWQVVDEPGQGRVTMWRAPDPLATGYGIGEFTDRYRSADVDPAKSWKSFPVAVRENGEAVNYDLQHLLGAGQTGSGKGSIAWAVISGLIPAAREGLVRFYAIDPKNAEAKAARGIFERIAVTPEQWHPMLQDAVDDLKKRQEGSGRSFQISRENPLKIFFIDEMSAVSVLDSDRQRASEVDSLLLTLLSQGRSDGFYVMALVQSPQKSMLGSTRQFFGMRAALRTETPIETDLILGDGSVDQGAMNHLITPANMGNGYATAGIGWMRVEGEAEPVRVRFPFTDDDTLQTWSDEFEALRAEREKAKTPAVETVEVAPVEVDADFWADDGDESAPTETPTHSLPKPEPAPVPAATDDDEGEWEE